MAEEARTRLNENGRVVIPSSLECMSSGESAPRRQEREGPATAGKQCRRYESGRINVFTRSLAPL
jgi:hypothetical protein